MSIKTYQKKDVCGFMSNDIKVEFSSPSIQPHDEYGYVKNPRDIMYYYYTVKGFYKDGDEWKTCFSRHTFDFPGILDFKNSIEAFLQNRISQDFYQKTLCGQFGTYYAYDLHSGFMGEDYYSVTHRYLVSHNQKGKETYNVTIGGSSSYTTSAVVGVTLNHLTRKEISKIYECVKSFIRYTIDKYNKWAKSYMQKDLSSWRIVNGKLHKISEDGTGIESVYLIGDVLDSVVVLCGDINSNNYYSVSYNNCSIVSMDDNKIIVTGGYHEVERTGATRRIVNNEPISVKNLVSIRQHVSDEKLSYNEDEIAKDFILTLSDIEIDEFKNNGEEYLFSKWKNAVLNRTWMCRSEHNLPKRVEDNGHHENVYASIKIIIKNIKEHFSS